MGGEVRGVREREINTRLALALLPKRRWGCPQWQHTYMSWQGQGKKACKRRTRCARKAGRERHTYAWEPSQRDLSH